MLKTDNSRQVFSLRHISGHNLGHMSRISKIRKSVGNSVTLQFKQMEDIGSMILSSKLQLGFWLVFLLVQTTSMMRISQLILITLKIQLIEYSGEGHMAIAAMPKIEMKMIIRLQ